jgi:hypothetical protein
MADEIEIITVKSHPQGGDAATIEVRYGAKKATLMLMPGSIAGMTKHSWRDELKALASALIDAPITDRSSAA